MNINELKKAYETMRAADKVYWKAYDKLTKTEEVYKSAKEQQDKAYEKARTDRKLWAIGMFVDDEEMLGDLDNLHKAEEFCANAFLKQYKAESKLKKARDILDEAIENWEGANWYVRDYLRDHGPVIINLMRGPEHVCEMLGLEYSRGERTFDPDALHMIAEIREYTCEDYIIFDLINIKDKDGIIIPGIKAWYYDN